MATLFSLPDSWPLFGAPLWTFGDWSFGWTIHGHHEGLILKNVSWKGVKVLHKASLPVIRVKYRGSGLDIMDGCGPYADRIGGVKTDELPGIDSDVAGRIWDDQLLEIAVYDEIGGYDLYQAWYFDRSGWMRGLLYSRGWSCGQSPPSRRDHHHHAYWRLDFDVESVSNEVWTFRDSQTGARTWQKQTSEGQGRRLSSEQAFGVQVNSTASSKFVHAVIWNNELRDAPGSPWFGFSNKDIGWRRYRSSEDNGWTFWGGFLDPALGHLGHASPPENIDREDIVIWMVGHLSHQWDGHDHAGNEWHHVGPTILPSW